jgi:HEPN domain-containing protein
MPPDPVRVANTRDWLARANEDIDTAEVALQAARPLIRSALFHCQQAVEKTMKAFLTWQDAPFRMTHNLIELGDQCAALEPRLGVAVGDGTPLAKYATRFRYPGSPYEPQIEEALTALGAARRFRASFAECFPPEVAPGPDQERLPL